MVRGQDGPFFLSLTESIKLHEKQQRSNQIVNMVASGLWATWWLGGIASGEAIGGIGGQALRGLIDWGLLLRGRLCEDGSRVLVRMLL